MTFDGATVRAEHGEPAAAALIAAGHLRIARSPKFHRPRGVSCMRAACDGCLARVDGVPNVMTCRIPARDGMEIVTQNTMGTRDLDLLRMTDWFFPRGLNHHELFAGVVGVERLMQGFARRVAGLGKLPAQIEPPKKSERRSADVLVIGSGASGMSVASELAQRGRSVEVIDDALELGGSLRALGSTQKGWNEIELNFQALVKEKKITARAHTAAVAIYGDDLLVVGDRGAEVVNAKTLVLAPGAHDGVLAFEGNDVPGVMSARAASLVLSRGVLVGEKIAIVRSPSGGPFGEAFAARAAEIENAGVTLVDGEPLRVHGTSRVRAVTVKQGKKEKKISCDALLVDAPRSPAYELAAQAGAKIEHRPEGFFVIAPGGKIRDGVFAIGELVGNKLDVAVVREEARDVASRV
jgi:sarcosine oxidase subunit alpha